MSFGRSPGDIASALKLLYNVIEVLDDVDGAVGNFPGAVSIIRDLKRTLEPLETLTATPSYAKEVEDEIKHIKVPVEEFLSGH
jgi:hypothetical protein